MGKSVLTPKEVNSFLAMDFANTVTGIINRLIGTELLGWNMDFLVGRSPFRLVTMSYKIHIAELWHNVGRSFAFLERGLLVSTQNRNDLKNRVAVRIGILWGVFGEMLWQNTFSREDLPDVVISEKDLPMLPGAWLARNMGLPLGNIVCCCEEKSPVWELFTYGTLHIKRNEEVSEEILLFLENVLGESARERLLAAKEFGGVFSLKADELLQLQKGVCVSVVSQDRLEQLKELLKARGYTAGEEGASAYGALQYYRAVKRSTAPAIVLLENMPEFMA